MFEKIRKVIFIFGLDTFFRKVYISIFPLLYRDKISREFVNPYSELEDKYHVVFVHIPKNAGNGFAESVFGMKPRGHNYLRIYKKYDRNKYSEYFKFALTRNVHSRFYSAYSYLAKGGFGVYDQEFSKKYISGMSFEDFVLKMDKDKGFAKSVMSWTHFIPQSEFILVDGVCELDYVGAVENISDAIDTLSDKLGIDGVNNTVVNSSGGGSWEEKYTSEMFDIVSRLYQTDLDLLKSLGK